MPVNQNNRQVGFSNISGTIQVHYITETIIHYHCSRCNENYSQDYLPIDIKGGWYLFECEKCGENSKRVVQLERFGGEENRGGHTHGGAVTQIV